jgi:hypothetical protein
MKNLGSFIEIQLPADDINVIHPSPQKITNITLTPTLYRRKIRLIGLIKFYAPRTYFPQHFRIS